MELVKPDDDKRANNQCERSKGKEGRQCRRRRIHRVHFQRASVRFSLLRSTLLVNPPEARTHEGVLIYQRASPENTGRPSRTMPSRFQEATAELKRGGRRRNRLECNVICQLTSSTSPLREIPGRITLSAAIDPAKSASLLCFSSSATILGLPKSSHLIMGPNAGSPGRSTRRPRED